jgi:hypothetical protein
MTEIPNIRGIIHKLGYASLILCLYLDEEVGVKKWTRFGLKC